MSNPSAGPVAMPFEGRTAFRSALGQAFSALAESDCREVWLCDRDFGDWPLGDAATLAQLTQWAQAHRRLVVVAATFDLLARRHPRWATWRRQWDHVIDCRLADATDADSIPCVFLAMPRVGIRLDDRKTFRGTVDTTPAGLVQLRLEFDAYLQRSYQSFPATTLGL